jgi:hypothetical protein
VALSTAGSTPEQKIALGNFPLTVWLTSPDHLATK